MPNALFTRRGFCIAGISVSALTGTSLLAFAKTVRRLSLSRTGTALKGYDTTAYFTTDKSAKCFDANSVAWKGAQWRCASKVDANLFRAVSDADAPHGGVAFDHGPDAMIKRAQAYWDTLTLVE